MSAQITSPVMKQPKITGMSFPDAIKELIKGKKITRISWDNTDSYGLLKDGFLEIYLDSKFHQWLVNDGDLLGEDWIVIQNAN